MHSTHVREGGRGEGTNTQSAAKGTSVVSGKYLDGCYEGLLPILVMWVVTLLKVIEVTTFRELKYNR